MLHSSTQDVEEEEDGDDGDYGSDQMSGPLSPQSEEAASPVSWGDVEEDVSFLTSLTVIPT